MSRVTLAVFGGTGFIGRAVAAAGRARGYEPVLLAPDDPAGAAVVASDVPVVYCDVASPESVREALATTRPGAMVHLAAYGSGPAGLLAGASENPVAAVDVNVRGLVNVVEAAGEVGLDRIVWSSSTTVYAFGTPDPRSLVDERVPPAPQTIYGATKAAAELMAAPLEGRTGVRPVGLRLPLVFGPGRWYGGSQDALVAFVADVAAGRPTRIQATDTLADWMYVDDAAHALLAALHADSPGHVYNLAAHQASLAELARAVAAHARAPAAVDLVARQGPDFPLVDGSAAVTDLGLEPPLGLASAAADYVARTEVTDAHAD
ncbi:NAD-dependent epimerase/dehydratase family protein [Egibacter rhizosphaerae]|uniref:NAD-dependent epimerase/dehydratase family protein n=1 Tax=Egibacter rhizosphaerae TaxID=1670831 RepID=UPI0013F151D5|nr:NAD-dependent epimerase/dehydratase family protein [Egibacter rhizosphaerae]